MNTQNYFEFSIPKGRKANAKMLKKVYGTAIVFDYTNPAISAKCRVYLMYGQN